MKLFLAVLVCAFGASQAYFQAEILKRHVSACEWKNVTLACPMHHQIDIKSAHWGKLEQTRCPKTPMPEEHCWHDVTGQAKKSCNDKTCEIAIKNDKFGVDPCRGIRKYMEVTYKCGAVQHKAEQCEHEHLRLACKNGEKPEIVEAFYGRTSATVCPILEEMPKYMACWTDVKDVVKAKCSGSRCTLKAENKEMTIDPCLGVHKYINVEFECIRYMEGPVQKPGLPVVYKDKIIY